MAYVKLYLHVHAGVPHVLKVSSINLDVLQLNYDHFEFSPFFFLEKLLLFGKNSDFDINIQFGS